jgi:hypothetical protein
VGIIKSAIHGSAVIKTIMPHGTPNMPQMKGERGCQPPKISTS